jgi:hypothetical protein
MSPGDSIPTWPVYLTAGRDVIVATATAIGVWYGWRSLSTWRRQMTGQVHWELARRMLRNTYAVREALNFIRGPFVSGAEVANALEKRSKPPLPLNEQQESARGLAAAYEDRWTRVQQAVADLDATRLEAEVLWGPDAASAVEPLRVVVRDLQVALYLLLTSQSRGRGHDDAVDGAEQTVYGIPDDQGRDRFADKLSAAIATAEQYLGPRLRS